MADIGLIDVDGHNFPNLALMKISSYHKRFGDRVEWAGIGSYDRTYMSKVFTFSQDYSLGLGNYGDIVKGGTGYGLYNNLPDEIDDALERIEFLRSKGVVPFAQPYRDFANKIEPSLEQKRLARYVNHKAIFNSIAFKDYK